MFQQPPATPAQPGAIMPHNTRAPALEPPNARKKALALILGLAFAAYLVWAQYDFHIAWTNMPPSGASIKPDENMPSLVGIVIANMCLVGIATGTIVHYIKLRELFGPVVPQYELVRAAVFSFAVALTGLLLCRLAILAFPDANPVAFWADSKGTGFPSFAQMYLSVLWSSTMYIGLLYPMLHLSSALNKRTPPHFPYEPAKTFLIAWLALFPVALGVYAFWGLGRVMVNS